MANLSNNENDTNSTRTLKDLIKILRYNPSLKKEKKAPHAKTLEENNTLIAETPDGQIKVYDNGYAVYDDGNHKTVIWVLDIKDYTSLFIKPKAGETWDMDVSSTISKEEQLAYL